MRVRDRVWVRVRVRVRVRAMQGTESSMMKLIVRSSRLSFEMAYTSLTFSFRLYQPLPTWSG